MGEFATPVLLLIFNRPDHTQKVFDQLRKLQPKFLFIGADGPRADNPADIELTRQCREIILQIDWPCEVKTLFRSENRGCGNGPAEAITWFFDHVPAGIILEDDVLPDMSFFSYCSQMLEMFYDDERIMHVSGCYFLDNFLPKSQDQYYFSKHVHVWGWATWKRAWGLYDYEIKDYSPIRSTGMLKKYYGKKYYTLWEDAFNLIKQTNLDAWDYQWMFTLCQNNGVAINPTRNLTSNIGFDNQATHTKNSNSIFTTISRSSIPGIDVKLKNISIDTEKDDLYYKYFLDFDPAVKRDKIQRLKRWLRKLKVSFLHS